MTIFYNYEEWEECLHPCDLILFSGNGFIGKIINMLEAHHTGTKGEWSHAGIVCPEDIINIKNKKRDQTCILESLISSPTDVCNIETNQWHNGLQIRDMKEVITNFISNGGKVACFHLNDNSFPLSIIDQRRLSNNHRDDYLLNLNNKDEFRKFWKKHSKSKYDCYNCGRAIGISFPFFSKNTTKNMFCSEAVTRLYQYMNIMNNDIDPEKISPEELGGWCGDVKGDSPFYHEPDVIMLQPTEF